MVLIQEAPVDKFEPRFDLIEDSLNGAGDMKLGQRINAVVNYEVIEKTKSFIILRINSFMVVKSRRSV